MDRVLIISFSVLLIYYIFCLQLGYYRKYVIAYNCPGSGIIL